MAKNAEGDTLGKSRTYNSSDINVSLSTCSILLTLQKGAGGGGRGTSPRCSFGEESVDSLIHCE